MNVRKIDPKVLMVVDASGNLVRGPLAIVEFRNPMTGLASPIRRTNAGFVEGGKTVGGATEFIVPNYRISDLRNVTQRIAE